MEPARDIHTVDATVSVPPPPVKSKGISAFGYVACAVLIGLGVAVIWFTRQPGVVSPWVQWGITIPWILVTGALGLYDLVLDRGKPGVTDAMPFDRWSISHTFVGAVFAVWYVPVWAVVAMTIVWEFFEVYIPGFGDQEILRNRMVDVGAAWVMYGVCVVLIMGTKDTGAGFPLLWPTH